MWENPVSPRPCPREGLALTQGDGEPGFPYPPPCGRGWKSAALPREVSGQVLTERAAYD